MEQSLAQIEQKTCCICFENIQDFISCDDCEEGIYCKKCLQEITKDDNTYTCSICRRENINKSIIIVQEEKVILSRCFQTQTHNIYNNTLNLLKILTILSIAIGVLLAILFLLSL